MITQGRFYPQWYTTPHFYDDNKGVRIDTPGNGITVYTGFKKILSIILVIFKQAVCVKYQNNFIVLNKSSFSKFLLREYTLEKRNSSYKTTSRGTQELQVDMQKAYQTEKTTPVLLKLNDASTIKKALRSYYNEKDFKDYIDYPYHLLGNMNLNVNY